MPLSGFPLPTPPQSRRSICCPPRSCNPHPPHSTGPNDQGCTVLSNAAGGDAVVGTSSNGLYVPIQSTGWYYTEVRLGGTVGIQTTYPRSSGGGSIFMSTTSSAGKAEVRYGVFPTIIVGPFSGLTQMKYDWYRDATSTTGAHLHPAMKVHIDVDGNLATTADRGTLIFELAYNPSVSPVPTNTWVTQAITSTSNLWSSGTFGIDSNTGPRDINNSGYAYDDTLAQWQAYFPNAAIVGFTVGIGSGFSGTFFGAADNIGWTIGGVTSSTAFEVSP
jgi:hypothetical protein